MCEQTPPPFDVLRRPPFTFCQVDRRVRNPEVSGLLLILGGRSLSSPPSSSPRDPERLVGPLLREKSSACGSRLWRLRRARIAALFPAGPLVSFFLNRPVHYRLTAPISPQSTFLVFCHLPGTALLPIKRKVSAQASSLRLPDFCLKAGSHF